MAETTLPKAPAPEVLAVSPFAPESLKKAIATQLEAAPPNVLTATARYEKDGTLRADLVVKVDRDRWVLAAGGFVEHDKDKTDYGAFGSVTITF